MKTLGGFQLYWDGKPESLGKQTNSNIVKLFLLLLTSPKSGISRSELIRLLYYTREVEDVGTNLRVTVYRLRQALKKMGIPCEDGEDYVEIQNGIYRWNQKIPVTLDAVEFERIAKESLEEPVEIRCVDLCRDAMLLYGGEYLPAFNTEDWVTIRQGELMGIFYKMFKKVYEIMTRHKDYQNAYAFAERAAQLHPYEEYQTYMMDCLMAMNRRTEALKLYEETTDMLFREMETEPSIQMKASYERIRNHMQATQGLVNGIQERLSETDDDHGAAYYVLPSFIDNYRFVRQLVKRTGQSAYVMVVMVKDTDEFPLGSDDTRTREIVSSLEHAICHALRKSDIFTRYNRFTFMALLMCTDEEGCQIAFERVVQNFRERCIYKKVRLRLKAFSVCEEY
ncbi:MAG: BTAD domain-containing putative transcriptional regulator [Eubacteriales bacterium]|nr:BTAD domain-containing putative transcriptional regulator [Eubacteriales bacterium]